MDSAPPAKDLPGGLSRCCPVDDSKHAAGCTTACFVLRGVLTGALEGLLAQANKAELG